MRVPAVPIGVVHKLLGILATADTWHGEPVARTFEAIIEAVEPEDAAVVPHALGECLLPLRGDKDRLRLVLDLVRRYDLYEAAEGLAVLLRESPTPEVVQTAAAIGAHPGAPSVLSELVTMVAPTVASMAGHSFVEGVESARTGFLPPGAGEGTRIVWMEAWPGKVPLKSALAPVVALSVGAGAPPDELRLLATLRRLGALVRRVPADTHTLPQGWLPDWAAIVVSDERPAWAPARGLLLRSRGSLSTSTRHRLVRELRQAFKGQLSLRMEDAALPAAAPVDPLGEPDAFFDGAFKLPEVVFLTGWGSSSVRNRGRAHEELRPQVVGRTHYYDFAQLVAFRVENYLATRFRRRPPAGLSARLVREARGERAVPTHVTAGGDIIFEYADGLADASGQGVIDSVPLLEVVQTFDLGWGRPVPGLLQPSAHTRVHPSVERGTPVVEDTRISAVAVAHAMETWRKPAFEGTDPFEHAKQYFPELRDEALRDAEGIGRQILV